MADSEAVVKLDLSDVEHRLGKRVGGGQLWEPCNKTDIRRWVMAMDYVNPLHWDQRFARETQFGDIIAPQSMAVALDYGHGNNQACVGRIPGQHMIFGGEEWWWYGTHVRPGDQLIQERIFTGYKVSETKFAGPTLFQRGVEGFSFDEEGAMIDSRLRDGLYVGPSRGHIDDSRASEIGMHRAYGYGATMAAWNTDYFAFWAGHDGLVRHAKSDFRGPAFEGDVTFIDGEVVDRIEHSPWGFPVVQVKVTMTNQDGKTVVTALNEVGLPH
jgi:acyl dehydratase